MLNQTTVMANAFNQDAEIARLREALRRIAALNPDLPIGNPPDPKYFINQAQGIAREALRGAR